MIGTRNDGITPSQSPVRHTLLAASITGLVLAGYIWLVGSGAVLDALERVSTARTVTLALAAAVPLLLWGGSLRIVFAAVGSTISTWKAVGLFVASVFLNSVTPFGQLGGGPPSALLFAREAGTSFESGLAAIAGVSALNRLAVVCLGVVGGTWYAARIAAAGVFGHPLAIAIALGIVGVAVAAVAWPRRDAVAATVGGAIAAVLAAIGSLLPVGEPPAREAVVARARRFVAVVERVAARPAHLVAAFLLCVAGQVAVAGVLWLVLTSVGVTVSPLVVFLVVPAAKLAGITPLPGGSGGAEALLSGLLVAWVGVPVAVAAAAALVYRAVVFWLPTVVGGLLTVAFLSRPADS